jgi:hypothetical protein
MVRWFVPFLSAARPVVQDQGTKSTTQQELESRYTLTKTTADKTDIVTAGAVLVLKKDNLMMVPANSAKLFQNIYKDGKLTQNTAGKVQKATSTAGGIIHRIPGIGGSVPVPDAVSATRTFVAGEKMWVTGMVVKDDGAVFELFTDAYGDVRYKASLTFPFAKGSVPLADQIERSIDEVFKIQPADESSATTPQQMPAGGLRPASQNTVVDQPPSSQPAVGNQFPDLVLPAPPSATPTISMGQTTEQVVSILGTPDKIDIQGDMKIYTYKALTVTFVSNKLAAAQ